MWYDVPMGLEKGRGCVDGRKRAALETIARALNGAGVRWAVGGSLMLYLRGAVGKFHDIDLVVSIGDAERAVAILDSIARRIDAPPSEEKARVFRSACFGQFSLDGVDVDLMAGMVVRAEGVEFPDPFDALGPGGVSGAVGEPVPLAATEDWYVLYALMPGRMEKARRIEAWWGSEGRLDKRRLERAAEGELPERVRTEVRRILGN